MKSKNTISREYVIFIKGYEYADVSYVYGKSPGEAKYNLWLKLSDCGCWENFFEFAKCCRCRLVDNLLRQ
jgi:hypothetical protein